MYLPEHSKLGTVQLLKFECGGNTSAEMAEATLWGSGTSTT